MNSCHARPFLALAVMIAASAPAPAADPGAAVDPGAFLWKGTVTLRREGSGTPVQPRPEPGKTVVVGGSRTVHETIAITVCGAPGTLYVRSVTRDLQDESTLTKNETVAETLCRAPKEMLRSGEEWPADHAKYVPQVKRPGHHGTSSSVSHLKILASAGAAPLRERTAAVLAFPGPALSAISGHQEALGEWQSDLVETSYDVCAETTSISEVHQRTGPPGQAPKSTRRVSDEGWTRRDVVQETSEPVTLRREFAVEAPWEGLGLKGSKVIERIDAPDYRETVTVEWDLRAESGCPDVYEQLLDDLAFGEAYAEPKLAEFADTMDDYETLVGDRAYRMRHGVNVPRGEESSAIDAATDEGGKQRGLDELREALKEQCKPDVIFESVAAHENVHSRQADQFAAYNDGTPASRGLTETSAYATGIRVLLDWLQENCPGTNTAGAERRLDRLEQIGERYMPE